MLGPASAERFVNAETCPLTIPFYYTKPLGTWAAQDLQKMMEKLAEILSPFPGAIKSGTKSLPLSQTEAWFLLLVFFFPFEISPAWIPGIWWSPEFLTFSEMGVWSGFSSSLLRFWTDNPSGFAVWSNISIPATEPWKWAANMSIFHVFDSLTQPLSGGTNFNHIAWSNTQLAWGGADQARLKGGTGPPW